MKITKLIEFRNQHGSILRGILTYSKNTKNQSVVMMGGFERSCTTETKFKVLADALIEKGVASFRFDHTGVGLSDGDFSHLSVKSLGDDLSQAIKVLKQEINFEKIFFASHSLPPCIMAQKDKREQFDKIILMSPALNQKELLRFWFVVNTMKKENPDLKITWENYKNYLDKKAFKEYCQKQKKMTKSHLVGREYFQENSEIDYSLKLPDQENILHIHGENDNTVPIKSLNTIFSNKIIVKGGDHDIERVDMLKQWVEKAVKFIYK